MPQSACDYPRGYSHRLPPPEAWKHPDRWLDLTTGLARPGIRRLELITDDRGLIRPDQVVEMVNQALFEPDYTWPYTIGDPETAPDDHHFYFTARAYSPDQNQGHTVPSRFRELPTHIGWMPRQFHNAIHDYVETPQKPSIEVMGEYVDSYHLAYTAFRRLLDAAQNTTRASAGFRLRKQTIGSNLVQAADQDDQVAQEFLQSFFAKHFRAYSESVEAWRGIAPEHSARLGVPEVRTYKPHLVVRDLGGLATRRHLNFVPILRAA